MSIASGLVEAAKTALGALWNYGKYASGFEDGQMGEPRNPVYRNDASYSRLVLVTSSLIPTVKWFFGLS